MERIVVLVESTDTNLLGKKHKCVVDRPTSLQHLFDQVNASLQGFESFATSAAHNLKFETFDTDFQEWCALDSLEMLLMQPHPRIRISLSSHGGHGSIISALMLRVPQLVRDGHVADSDRGILKDMILRQRDAMVHALEALDRGNGEPLSELLLSQQSVATDRSSASGNAGAGGGNIGRWTEQEQNAFVEGLQKYGKNWKKISQLVKTRSLTQIRTHAQKFFKKTTKGGKALAGAGATAGEGASVAAASSSRGRGRGGGAGRASAARSRARGRGRADSAGLQAAAAHGMAAHTQALAQAGGHADMAAAHGSAMKPDALRHMDGRGAVDSFDQAAQLTDLGGDFDTYAHPSEMRSFSDFGFDVDGSAPRSFDGGVAAAAPPLPSPGVIPSHVQHLQSQQQAATGLLEVGARPSENTGRWTKQEQDAFVLGLQQHGKNWKKIAAMVKTRSLTQIRTHAQKFFKKNAAPSALPSRSSDDLSFGQVAEAAAQYAPDHPRPLGADVVKVEPASGDAGLPSADMSAAAFARSRRRTPRIASSDPNTPSHVGKRTRVGARGRRGPSLDAEAAAGGGSAAMMGMAMAGAAVGDGSIAAHEGPGMSRGVVPVAAQIAQDAVRQQHHAQMQAQMQAASMRPTSSPWSREEVSYAETLTNEFFTGRLPLPNGTTLLTFLATALNCDSQRVAQRFSRTVLAPRLQEPFVHKEHLPAAVQMELKHLEAKFLEMTAAKQRGLGASRVNPPDPPLSMHLPSGSAGSGPRFQNAAQKFRARSRSSDMLQRVASTDRAAAGLGPGHADDTMDSLANQMRMMSRDGPDGFNAAIAASLPRTSSDAAVASMLGRPDSLASNTALDEFNFDIETDVNLMDFSSFDRRSRSQSQSTGGARGSASGSAPPAAAAAAQAAAGAAEAAQNPSLETALIEDFF